MDPYVSLGLTGGNISISLPWAMSLPQGRNGRLACLIKPKGVPLRECLLACADVHYGVQWLVEKAKGVVHMCISAPPEVLLCRTNEKGDHLVPSWLELMQWHWC